MNIKKRILKIICVVIAIIVSMFLVRSIKLRNDIDKTVGLSKEERKNINYKELIEEFFG